ncbi:MAG: MmcQ/YjbR family DNA-binding protein [Saprospiraceae bacterium]|nr:MmcQ/YjbR family DNA-binding protein [Saprospiraceae bacterium]
MNLKNIRNFCLSFPGVTEEVKWRQDRYFSVAEEPFCITDSDTDGGASFKVLEGEFDEMITREGIIPAPYMDRDHWVYVLDFSRLDDSMWTHYIHQSYELVKAKLPKKIRENL